MRPFFMRKIRIVGGGIAGSTLAMQAHIRGYSIEWWHYGKASSSLIASGIYNPLVLKRLKLVWRALEFSDSAKEFYKKASELLGEKVNNEFGLWHKFSNIGFENDWQAKSSIPPFSKFLGAIEQFSTARIGEVIGAGQLDTSKWISATRNYLDSKNHLVIEKQWTLSDNDDISTVLCQGWKVDSESFGIPQEAFSPVKGEVLILKLKDYPYSDLILHSGVFILPLGNEHYKVGATYHWDHLDEVPSGEARKWLVQEFQKLWEGPFEIVDQLAAVRPAVKDRKPILGAIPNYRNLYVLNGLGSRGTLMAPLLSEYLLDRIEFGKELPEEVRLQRFF
jgi:glycine/D-amino acid oxidase-like deaminating enzyme